MNGITIFFQQWRMRLPIGLCVVLLAPSALAQSSITEAEVPEAAQVATNVESKQEPRSVDRFASIADADRVLAEVSKERARIEEKFIEDERTCYPKFFTTWCLDKVKEARRQDLDKVRSIEIEARRFIRSTRADEHDKALAQRRIEAELDDARREKQQRESAPKN